VVRNAITMTAMPHGEAGRHFGSMENSFRDATPSDPRDLHTLNPAARRYWLQIPATSASG